MKFFFISLFSSLIFVLVCLFEVQANNIPYLKHSLADDIQVYSLPERNNERLLEKFPEEKGSRLQVAFPNYVNIDFLSHATKVDFDNHSRVYILKFVSKDALFMSLNFSKMKIPSGATLFVYGNKTTSYYPIQSGMDNALGGFQSDIYRGDTLFVELDVPNDIKELNAELIIENVNHGFRPFGDIKPAETRRKSFGDSESCEVDINCSSNSEYQLLKRSVCRVFISGSHVCTGTLMNSRGVEKPPYVLTANHCIQDETEAANAIFHFNYESYTCNGLEGPTYNLIRGSLLRSTSIDLDFSLVEMNGNPSPFTEPYYAGWDATGNLTDMVYAIHHPKGDVKKLSVSQATPSFSQFDDKTVQNSSILIKKWNLGVTEGGSSGGALFDNKKVIGSLIGGAATCVSPNYDYYTSLFYTYDHFPEKNMQLKYWLSNGADIRSMEGYDPQEDANTISELNLNIDPFGDYRHDYGDLRPVEAVGERFQYSTPVSVHYLSLNFFVGSEFSKLSDHRIVATFYNMNDLFHPVRNFSFLASLVQKDKSMIIKLPSPLKMDKDHMVVLSIEGENWQDYLSLYYSAQKKETENTAYFKLGEEFFPMSASPVHCASSFFIGEIISHPNKMKTAIQIQDSIAIKIFPEGQNLPGHYRIQSQNDYGLATLSIYDILGNKLEVKQLLISSGETSLVIDDLPSGIYLFSLRNEHLNFKGKMVMF
ncbi:trypsin-like peptidase domain-containing protein [Halosquirtibacter laminarini]|uniref:Trypsin-like peptidase domain-containing protein n=1 Tax=Halosquirtibacter laminarini TaxID=3374600 RepID=A0AC61NL76_9BACT|nr:trypsin-like peptidase domain-containing protein [Prolixibacteraceae bacterium]